MTKIQLTCQGGAARARVAGEITAGMVGVPVELALDAAWEGLTCLGKVRCGDVVRSRMFDETGCMTVPTECLLGGRRLEIGVDGWSEDGQLRIPTVWADCGIVRCSVAEAESEAAEDTVTPGLAVQVLQAAERARELAEALREDADNGKFAGPAPKLEDGIWQIWDADSGSWKSTGVAAGGDVKSVNGRIGQVVITPMDVGGEVTPEQFGAVGDGIADDTAAMRDALAHGRVLCRGSYRLTEQITVEHDCCLYGGGTLIADGGLRMLVFRNANVTVEGLKLRIVSANRTFLGMYFDRCRVTERDLEITVPNVVENADRGMNLLLHAQCLDVLSDGIYCHDIYTYGNHQVGDDVGNVTCLGYQDCAGVTVSNCTFREIHNIDREGRFYVEDTNAIYPKGAQSSVIITGCRFYNAGKRAVKTQCAHVCITNCEAYSDTDDCLVAFGIQEYAGGLPVAVVDNCIIRNHVTKHDTSPTWCIAATTENMTVSNCVLESLWQQEPYSRAVLATGSAVAYYNCLIRGSVDCSERCMNEFYGCRMDTVVYNGTMIGRLVLHNCRVLYRADFVDLEAYHCSLQGGTVQGNAILEGCSIAGTMNFYGPARLVDCTVESGVPYMEIWNNFEIDRMRVLAVGNDYFLRIMSGTWPFTGRIVNSDPRELRIAFPMPNNYTFDIPPVYVDSLPEEKNAIKGMVVQYRDLHYYQFNGFRWVMVTDSVGGSTLGSFTIGTSKLGNL